MPLQRRFDSFPFRIKHPIVIMSKFRRTLYSECDDCLWRDFPDCPRTETQRKVIPVKCPFWEWRYQ